MPQFRNVGNMPAPSSPPLCCRLAPHIFVCNERVSKPEKPTPGSSTIGKKPACVCPHPGRLDGDAGPSGGNGGDDEQPRPRRAHALMINSSGFYDYKPRKGGRQTCKAEAYTTFRSPPPPPPPRGGSSVPVNANSSGSQGYTARQDSQSMSTLRRMLTPPVSDSNSPVKKQPSEPVQVFLNNGNYKTKPNGIGRYRTVIRLPPSNPDSPNPAKQHVNPFNSTHEATKQKHWRDKSLPSIVENVTDNDSDNDDERETSLASPDSGRSDGDIEAQDSQSMSTFQRMLSPPVSDSNFPPTNKLELELVQVSVAKDHVFRGWIKNMPFPNRRPDEYARNSSSNGVKNATKKKHSGGKSIPSVVDNGSDNGSDTERNDLPVGSYSKTSTCTTPMLDADETDASVELSLHSDKPKEGAKSPGNTLTTAMPPPDSDNDVQDDSNQNRDIKDAEDAARLRRMLSPPVADDNSSLKQQPSAEFRVFYNSGNRKTKPNTDHHLDRTAIRQPPSQNKRSDPDKQKEIEFLARQKKREEKRKRKAKARRDQRLNRPCNSSSNDADKEDNGINPPVSSNTRSSSSSASQAFFTPPTTPTAPSHALAASN